jgi:hypothetical protein
MGARVAPDRAGRSRPLAPDLLLRLVGPLVGPLPENRGRYGSYGAYGEFQNAVRHKGFSEFLRKTAFLREVLDTEGVTCSIHVPPKFEKARQIRFGLFFIFREGVGDYYGCLGGQSSSEALRIKTRTLLPTVHQD